MKKPMKQHKMNKATEKIVQTVMEKQIDLLHDGLICLV